MVAQWETWAAANMLISARGQVAEEHADEQIARALADGNEGDETIWRAIAEQIGAIRTENRKMSWDAIARTVKTAQNALQIWWRDLK